MTHRHAAHTHCTVGAAFWGLKSTKIVESSSHVNDSTQQKNIQLNNVKIM